MSLLEDARNPTPGEDESERTDHDRPLTADDGDTATTSTAATTEETEEHTDDGEVADDGDPRPVHGPVDIDPSGRIEWRGMRIRRVRLQSVAKLSFIFWLLSFAVLIASAVVVWNVMRAFGFISEIEDAIVTSLGIDAFEIDGGGLFTVTAAVIGFLTFLGWVMTVLLAAVYNASCAVFGGLAVETGPLKRRKRVFSLRHRGFVTIRS